MFLCMGPQDQHHEMGYVTASLVYEQCEEVGYVFVDWCIKLIWKANRNDAFMSLQTFCELRRDNPMQHEA